MSEWRPIDEEPRDGKERLFWGDHDGYLILRWEDRLSSGMWMNSSGEGYGYEVGLVRLRCFADLPDPPQDRRRK